MSDKAVEAYRTNGEIPWSHGYSETKHALVERTLSDRALMEAFRTNDTLPAGFGRRMDERVVEYPWALARLSPNAKTVFDAGSTLNKPFLLAHSILEGRKLFIYTLDADWIALNHDVSYIFGDFRELVLRDQCVDAIVCISTLEHVGMGQDYAKYSAERPWPDQNPYAYRQALFEFHRILRPGGQLLVTVPFGRAENHGWLQQFDESSLLDLKVSFPGKLTAESYYRYAQGQWQSARAGDCREASYFNIHAASGFDADYAAAARAVACLEFRR